MAMKLDGTARVGVRVFLLACLPIGLSVNASQLKPKLEFGQDIQPIIKAHCIQCHGEKNPAGRLSLATFTSTMKGGVSGAALVKSQSAKSQFLHRIEGKDGKPRMPMGFGPLSAKDTQTIKDWIDQGCPEGATTTRKHWAYLTPTKPIVPRSNSPWIKNPIDNFVLAGLQRSKLKPSPEAERTTLIRRLTIDLTGLTPTPSEVDAYIADRSPTAYEKVVDRLLASPHFGEKLALPWLDAARYADSNGFQMDGDTYQYIWRDWVVKAFNDNMPFDEFTTKQLAGDLLPNPTQDDIVATAFNRNHMLNNEGGAIPEEQRNVGLFDRVDTTSTTWLGLTMTCTRCHDHKYDPLTQKDYFSMMAFFNNVPETGVPSDNDGKHFIAKPWIYAGTKPQLTDMNRLEEELKLENAKIKPGDEDDAGQLFWEKDAKTGNEELDDILAIDRTKRNQDQKNKVREAFFNQGLRPDVKARRDYRIVLSNKLNQLKADIPRVMVMSDALPRKTHIFDRGNYMTPSKEVAPETPESLPKSSELPKNRLDLAKWMVSPQNPLTTRVQVNRIWQMLFGKGLVRTPENYGLQGEPPTHPELLDWLAVDFRENKWNLKRLIKLIVTSSTYRQSSRTTRALTQLDPDNRLLARGARFRMPSMILRDQALATSGLLNSSIGGKPVYPYQPKGIWDGLNISEARNFEYPQSKGTDLYRRSIYSFWRRTVAPGDMFDSSSRQICTVRPSQTSTPLHALTTLNVTWVESARALAQRVMKSQQTTEGQLKEAFRIVCARRPNVGELKVLLQSYKRSLDSFTKAPKNATEFLSQGESPRDLKLDPAKHAAMASVCLAIVNLDEALTRE
jgi:Protein of unknown function (DUF1553)/Protein of unknown function (DUF1549)/Planctomycete cytochrome C